MTRRRGDLPALLLTLGLAWLVVYPLVLVGAEAAHADLGAFLGSRAEWAALWASLWISLASVALAAVNQDLCRTARGRSQTRRVGHRERLRPDIQQHPYTPCLNLCRLHPGPCRGPY